MNTIRIGLFGSVLDGSWFLVRKARELIDHHQVKPSNLCFLVDTSWVLRSIVGTLLAQYIPFRKIEKVDVTRKETSILLEIKDVANIPFYCRYWFVILTQPLGEKRYDFAKCILAQDISEAYLALCNHTKAEGEELAFLFKGELCTTIEWRNPGVIYYQKENDKWTSNWFDEPRWMVPELLVRIADVLAIHQEQFLERGFVAMRPLTMREVASRVGCSESSVSRVIAGVEAETPWGRLPLKAFFSPLVGPMHNLTSQTSIKAKLLGMISNEDKYKPLSDEILSKQMREEGIDVSRRTVAKYRQSLGIPSTSKRRHRKIILNNY